MLDFELVPAEVRVLGCLLEKEMTTPEYYPLSLNALVNACNQKSNRNPVVSYDEAIVLEALDGLKAHHLAWQSNAARVPKFEEHFGKSFNLVPREMAVVCLLLLRGPQTLGELRARSDRMYGFADIEEVSETIASLEEMGLARQQPRQPGQKESRFVHLLAGEPEVTETAPDGYAPDGPTGGPRVAREEKIADLEEEIAGLREELADLRQAFLDFKSQFD